jgi:RND family efflux transporter MFP subunit
MAGGAVAKKLSEARQPLVYYAATRGDLPIVVTERGYLESQLQTIIRCEVESLGPDRGGNSGTQILFIVPNGTAVTKGDLIVELDSAALKDRLDNQVIAHERGKAEQVQAEAKYENQQTQNETRLAEAELKVELADLALKVYEDGEDGTYQITLRDLQLKIEEAQNGILEAQAAMAMQTTQRNGIDMLHKLGYRGKGDVEQAHYNYLKAEDSLVRSANAMKNAVSNRKKLEQYEHAMKTKELVGALDTTKRSVLQVKRDNESLLAQADAARLAARQALVKEREKLDKYQAQLSKCKIYAPHDGMAAYYVERDRSSRSSAIGEGAFVYERQRLLTLPDLSVMQVRTAVHESVLDQVREGLPTTIKVDAFPDRTYSGTIKSVAVLPDQGGWLSSDIKIYETLVTIDEEVSGLKPGMTAVVEIHVDRLEDVLSVPVQAIVQIGRESWCYVAASGDAERRMVTLGRSNDKFVEIREGLKEGERVVLNPMALADEGLEEGRSIAPDSEDPESKQPNGRPPELVNPRDGEAAKTSNGAGSAEPRDSASPKGARPGGWPERKRGKRPQPPESAAPGNESPANSIPGSTP